MDKAGICKCEYHTFANVNPEFTNVNVANDPFPARLSAFVDSLGLTKKSFAEKVGLAQSIVTHLTNGRNLPGLDAIQKILNSYPTLNPDWLLMGKGEMLRKPTGPDTSELKKELGSVSQKLQSVSYELHTAIKMVKILEDKLP